MWPVLMSARFNIRTDHCLASLTCWLTSWTQCTLDGQKGEELKVQRPPSGGISHLGIDLGGGGGVGWLRNVKQLKGVCRVHFTVEKPPPPGIIHVCLFTCPAVCRWRLTQFLNWRCKWAPEVCLDCYLKHSWFYSAQHLLNFDSVIGIESITHVTKPEYR